MTNDPRTPSPPPGPTKPAPARRRSIHPASAQALALLTRLPIFAAAVPRLHVGPRGADGSIRVDDRATDRTYLVYTPRREAQFRAGHRAGRWYVRPRGDSDAPTSGPGFPSARAAIESLRTPGGPPTRAAAPRRTCRVLWS